MKHNQVIHNVVLSYRLKGSDEVLVDKFDISDIGMALYVCTNYLQSLYEFNDDGSRELVREGAADWFEMSHEWIVIN